MTIEHDQRKDIQYMTENFQRLEKKVDEGFATINNQLIMMSDTYVRKSEHRLQDAQIELKIENVAKRTEQLEGANTWIVRTVATTILGTIGALLVALFK